MRKESLFDDHYKANQKAKQNRQKQNEVTQKQPKNIIKDGNWTPSEKQRISNTLDLAVEYYPNNLQQQANFIQFQLQTYLGIRIQILVYNFKAAEGHCLHAVDGKFIQIQHDQLIYVIWKVRLIEDLHTLKNF